jgi:hypothetical protein
MTAEWSLLPLGVLAFRGSDAPRFLQGQLSADVLKLAPGELRWSGCHNAQGRALALPRLWCDGADVCALLPRELVADLVQHLRRYVLRAKVALLDETDLWRVHGIFAPPASMPSLGAGVAILPANPAGTRTLLLQRESGHPALALEPSSQLPVERWRRLDLADGLPQVYAATSGHFVAQMLNLDLVGGIALDKGCYTGQEVIARAHYRGRVKRRMQRFRSGATRAADWPPGATGELPDGRRFEIVDSVDLDEGGCEWLAVAATVAAAGAESNAVADASAAATDSRQRLCDDAVPLPLPYPLPQD